MKREDLKCDVLVIGGGVGGLACAASVKERMPEADVIVVEKNFAGYSGKANRGGGVLQYFDPKRVKAEDFLKFHVNEIGCYLGNQDLMLRYVNMNTEIIEKMESWGVNIPREENGNFHVRPTGPMTAMICVDLDLCLKIRRVCEKAGVRFLDKTVMADLLTTKLTIKKPFPPSEKVIDVVTAPCATVCWTAPPMPSMPVRSSLPPAARTIGSPPCGPAAAATVLPQLTAQAPSSATWSSATSLSSCV